MPTGAIIGCVEVFCGVLLCVIPNVVVQGVGGGLIASGIKDIIDAYARENEKKSMWMQSYKEMFPWVACDRE